MTAETTKFTSGGCHYGTDGLELWKCEACGVEFMVLVFDGRDNDQMADFCPKCGAKRE